MSPRTLEIAELGLQQQSRFSSPIAEVRNSTMERSSRLNRTVGQQRVVVERETGRELETVFCGTTSLTQHRADATGG